MGGRGWRAGRVMPLGVVVMVLVVVVAVVLLLLLDGIGRRLIGIDLC